MVPRVSAEQECSRVEINLGYPPRPAFTGEGAVQVGDVLPEARTDVELRNCGRHTHPDGVIAR
jgi:hypothetical protein